MKEDNKIIDLFNNGVCSKEICLKFKKSSKYVKLLLEKNNIDTKKNINRKYFFNFNYFEQIDTVNKAYWLGFIYADGCILKKDKSLKIGLKLSDKEHLEKFKLDIGFNGPIHEEKRNSGFNGEPQCVIRLYNLKMINDLNNKGVYCGKTYNIKFPSNNILSENLISHFIRGFYDGDGGVSISGKRNRISLGICGEKEFLIKINDILFNQCRLKNKNKVVTVERTDNNLCTVKYNDNSCLKILGWLYENSLQECRLERKYIKYKNYDPIIKEVCRKSKYIGVSDFCGSGKWRARITINQKEQHLGSFLLEDKAAAAYDVVCWDNFKDKGKLNFPEKVNGEEYAC